MSTIDSSMNPLNRFVPPYIETQILNYYQTPTSDQAFATQAWIGSE